MQARGEWGWNGVVPSNGFGKEAGNRRRVWDDGGVGPSLGSRTEKKNYPRLGTRSKAKLSGVGWTTTAGPRFTDAWAIKVPACASGRQWGPKPIVGHVSTPGSWRPISCRDDHGVACRQVPAQVAAAERKAESKGGAWIGCLAQPLPEDIGHGGERPGPPAPARGGGRRFFLMGRWVRTATSLRHYGGREGPARPAKPRETRSSRHRYGDEMWCSQRSGGHAGGGVGARDQPCFERHFEGPAGLGLSRPRSTEFYLEDIETVTCAGRPVDPSG